jgi:pimeloyl-ACP methyl ester carboxylesterase
MKTSRRPPDWLKDRTRFDFNTIRATIFSMLRSMLLLYILLAAGCARLPAGQLDTLSQPQPAVVLIRGYQDWYSTGIDQLAAKLRAADFSTEVFREEQWHDVASELELHRHSPLILIGFSYGADDVILIARRLNDAHRSVELLITIDPVTPAKVPVNVKQAVNYYEPNGIWDIFPWLRGIPLTADPGAAVQNINIRSRADLHEPDTSHATIAGNPKIHAAIEGLIANILHRS